MPLFVAQEAGKGGVLSELSGSRRPRNERVENICHGAFEQAPPFPQPAVTCAVHPLEVRKVLTGFLQRPLRVSHDLARDRVAKPQTSDLIASQTVRSSSKCFYVIPADATMSPRRIEREIAPIA